MAHVLYCFPLANEEVLNQDNLVNIIDVLKDGGFTTSNWRELGLRLSISHDDLTIIETNYPKDVVRCLEECLVKWLKTGKATYTGLAEALKKMGEGAAADYISEYWHHCKVKFPNLFNFFHSKAKERKVDKCSVQVKTRSSKK